MRRWFLIVMIALLPLRAWVGDAMAGQMLSHPSQSTQAAAHQAMPDCPGHMQAAESGATSPLDATVSCASCQVCSAVALQPSAPLGVPGALPQALQPLGTVTFASAAPAPSFKPPIS